MGKEHAILWLAVATLIVGTADAAKLVRHYRFQNPSNLGQAAVGPGATSQHVITRTASPGGWGFKAAANPRQRRSQIADGDQCRGARLLVQDD